MMEEIIGDAEKTNGLVVVSGKKTMPWLTPWPVPTSSALMMR